MNHGVVKQLDSDDLLPLPTDMGPSSCHDVILSCWRAQLSNNGSNPSLFRALCSAYGWPYLRLGLLKVFFNRKSRSHTLDKTKMMETKACALLFSLYMEYLYHMFRLLWTAGI